MLSLTGSPAAGAGSAPEARHAFAGVAGPCGGGGGEEVPGLTCYQADWYGLGQRAMQILLSAVTAAEPFTPEHHLFPYHFQRGVTTGPLGK